MIHHVTDMSADTSHTTCGLRLDDLTLYRDTVTPSWEAVECPVCLEEHKPSLYDALKALRDAWEAEDDDPNDPCNIGGYVAQIDDILAAYEPTHPTCVRNQG